MADLTDRFTIVGGGYSGLVLALNLHEKGFRNIEVLDSGEESATLKKAHMFTVKRATGINRLAKMSNVNPEDLYVAGIEFRRWIGLREDDPSFIFNASVSDAHHAFGLINPDFLGAALISSLRSRGVNLQYRTSVITKDGKNGQALVAISEDSERAIATDYLFDATNFGIIFRSLKGRDSKSLLADDPRICDILCKRIEGTMNADVFVSTYGHSFGPFSWMAPSSQDTEYQYQPRTIDFIATRYCYLSERNERILAQRLRNMLVNARNNPVIKKEITSITDLENIIDLSDQELSLGTDMRGFYRMEPSRNIRLGSAPHIAGQGVFLVGNAAGWGDPTMGNIFYASLEIADRLASMLKEGREREFYNWWRYNGVVDYDFSMAFKHSRISPKGNGERRKKFVQAVNSLSDEAKFAAAVSASISWPNKFRLLRGNFRYLAELLAKTHLPFHLGYIMDGGYCYGKEWGMPHQPLTFSFGKGLSRETRPYGY